VVRTDQRYLADASRRLDSLTLHGTFAEALALLTGYDAARASAYLAGFQRWLATRAGVAAATPIAELVLRAADVPTSGDLSPDEDARASAALFALLDEYLETKTPA